MTQTSVAPVGTHCILELHGCPADLLNDVLFIRDSLEQASTQGMSTLLKLSSHRFEPQGVTAVALLAESHVSIHTWPESGYAAVDVFTFGQTAQPQRACAYLIERLRASDHDLLVLPRGAHMPMGEASASPQTRIEETALCPVRS